MTCPPRATLMTLSLLLIGAPALPVAAMETSSATQTIVFVRHGEKPAAGLGQITCQGLNRALALPAVIARKFGTPIAVFAPDPAKRKDDVGVSYDYVRPMATIEPTAIINGLPIHADFGFTETGKLRRALAAPALHNGLVVVAWEHKLIDEMARSILKATGADPKVVPTWDGRDFDSIYVLRISRDGSKITGSFALDTQGLNGLPDACPK